MGKPHIYAEVIKAWADGKDVQVMGYHVQKWVDDGCPTWSDLNQYRIKPEPKYPETRATVEELDAIYSKPGNWRDAFVGIANYAIRRAIEDGDVILPENKGE